MSAMVLVHLIAAQFDTSMTRNNVAHMPISFELNDDEVSDGKRKVYIYICIYIVYNIHIIYI